MPTEKGQENWSGQLWNKCVMAEISSSFPLLEFHFYPEAQGVKPKLLWRVGFFSVVCFLKCWSGVIKEIGCSVLACVIYIKNSV